MSRLRFVIRFLTEMLTEIYLPAKFHKNLSASFWVILLTVQQTNRQNIISSIGLDTKLRADTACETWGELGISIYSTEVI